MGLTTNNVIASASLRRADKQKVEYENCKNHNFFRGCEKL